MKNNIYVFFSVVLFGFIFNSCEEMISNVDVPEYIPKLVVFSYISPCDTIVTVKVSKSTPVFGTNTSNPESYSVSNATVVISDGMSSKVLPYFENYHETYEGIYVISQKEFPVVAGKTYYLEVSSPGGFHVTSSCSVPVVPAAEVVVDTFNLLDNGDDWTYRVGFHFKDISGAQNYWRISATSKWLDHATLEPHYYNVSFDIGDYLVSDAGRNGENISYMTDYFEMSTAVDSNFFVCLYAVDEPYYTFHKEEIADHDYGNPFSEPVVLITNIEGGLGLFSGYNKRIYAFTLGQ